MEEIASLCYYQENNIHELKDRLLCTSLELESVRKEMRKNNHALNLAYRERDEAISQYHNLLHKIPQPPISPAHPDNSIIDIFVKGKDLPQKGMFLKAVLDAGPLLQTVLVAGPLPQWRNPPPVHTSPVPPVESSNCGPEYVANGGSFLESSSCASSDGFSAVGSCLLGGTGGELWVAAAAGGDTINVNGYCQMRKKQRIW